MFLDIERFQKQMTKYRNLDISFPLNWIKFLDFVLKY